jgi:hypothetical protein
MIEKFENIDCLIHKIKEDKNTKNITEKRFPIRYILLSNFNTLRKLIEEMNKVKILKFEISQLLPKDDGWITKQEFINTIKNLRNDKDYLILPFSEIARFYNKQDFNNLFSQLTEFENIGSSNQRIYIPLMGIKVRFLNEFYNNFNRKQEYSFIWEINELPQKNNIFLYNDLSININYIQSIKGTKEWLNLWKKDFPTPALLLSKTLFFLADNAKPDEIFDFKKIHNPKELLINIFDVDIHIEFNDLEREFWFQIIDKFNTNRYISFYEFVKDVVNSKIINDNNFIELWLTSNRSDFEKWLIKNYFLSFENSENSYLYEVLKNLNSYNNLEFLMRLWDTIFKISKPTKEQYDEREELLKRFYYILNLELPVDFINDYKLKLEEKDDETKLKVITGILEFEKEIIIKNQYYSILDKFPYLQKYLEDFECDNLAKEQQWVYSYFKEYKKSKIKNLYTDDIKLQINKLNKDESSFFKWYYSFKDVATYLNNEKFDYVFWIDAIGIEWISLIEYLLKVKDYNVEKKYIARANLPSTTELNKYDISNVQYFQDFDKLIHSSTYQYPSSIVQEINKIDELITRKIVLQSNKRAVIISDHGSSALVRLNNSSKNFEQADHEGRYIKSKNINTFQPDENYIIKDNYIIASKHISLSSKPIREVHGGCTPEEVLVPVIIFNSIPNYNQQKDQYNIELITNELNIRNPMIIFEILPSPKKKVYLVYKNYKIELSKHNINQFTTNINDIGINRAGQYKVKVEIGVFQKEFVIIVKSGFKEEELF